MNDLSDNRKNSFLRASCGIFFSEMFESQFIIILSGIPYRLSQLGIYNYCEAGLLSTVIFEIFDFGDLRKFKKCAHFTRWIPAQGARMTIKKKTGE